MTVHFDQRVLDALLRSHNVAEMVTKAGEDVAGKVDAQRITVGGVGAEAGDTVALPVRVETFTEDGHAEAFVELAHPAGVAVQAKYGALTKAASALGIRVSGS